MVRERGSPGAKITVQVMPALSIDTLVFKEETTC